MYGWAWCLVCHVSDGRRAETERDAALSTLGTDHSEHKCKEQKREGNGNACRAEHEHGVLEHAQQRAAEEECGGHYKDQPA